MEHGKPLSDARKEIKGSGLTRWEYTLKKTADLW